MVVVQRRQKWYIEYLRGSKLAVPEGPRRLQNLTVAGTEGQSLGMTQYRKYTNIP